MAWLRLDDGFAEHPKVLGLTVVERWSWVEVLLYCARRRTSGVVTLSVLERCGFVDEGRRLLELGLLDRRGDELVVHDWNAYNGARTGAERTAAWRDRKYGESRTTHGGRRGAYASESGSTPSSVTAGTSRERHGDVSTRAQPRARVPQPHMESSSPTSDVDSAPAAGDIDGSSLLVAARLLALLGDIGEARADYVRGACARLPESVPAGLLELLEGSGSAHVRDRVGYVLGSLKRELEERGL